MTHLLFGIFQEYLLGLLVFRLGCQLDIKVDGCLLLPDSKIKDLVYVVEFSHIEVRVLASPPALPLLMERGTG